MNNPLDTRGGSGFGQLLAASVGASSFAAGQDGDAGAGIMGSQQVPENTEAAAHEEAQEESSEDPEHQAAPPQPTQPTVFKPPNELAWDARVEELLEYKRAHGDTDVPNTFDENPSLARWVGDQRRAYKRGNMAKHRIDRLEEIGFLWSKAIKSPWEIKWDARFAELEKFMYKYGQIGTTLNGNVHPQWHTLSEWATHQRKRYKEGKLRKDLAEKLESIHFLWDTERYLWEKHYALLVKVQRDKKNPDDPTAFRRWVTKQRDAYHDGTLPPERVDLLNEVNFHWGEPPSATSTSSAAASTAAVDDSPDASAASGNGGGKPAPSSSHHHHEEEVDDDEDHEQHRSAAASSAEARQLTASLAAWDVQYKALGKYKREHGHLNVSHDQRKYASLASWCRDMRTLHRRKELGNDKKKKLKDLGFRWANRKTGPKASWEERFAQLKDLLRQHQGMEGLLHYAAAAESLRSKSDDPSLLETIVSWVDYQRVLRKHHKLDQDKIDRLTAVGLVWDAHQAAWDARFKQLVSYSEHGIKPRDYSSYVKWEHRQRREYRLGTLNHDRIERLNSIGFRWEPRPTRRRASNQSHTSRHSATSSDGGGGGGRAAFGVGDAAPRLVVGGGTGAPEQVDSYEEQQLQPNHSNEGSHSVSSWDESHRGGVSRPRRRRRQSYDDDGEDDDDDGSGHTDEYLGRGPQPAAAKRMRPSPTSSLDDYDTGYGRRGRGRRIGTDEAGLKSGTSAEDYDDDEDDDGDDHHEDDGDADADHNASSSHFYQQDYSAYAAGR